MEDSVDVAQHTTEREVKVEGASDKGDKNSEEDLKHKDEDESNEDNNWSSSQQLVEDESGSIDHQSYLSGVDSEKEPDSKEKVEIKDKDDSLKSETKTPVDMEDTPRSTKDRTERFNEIFFKNSFCKPELHVDLIFYCLCSRSPQYTLFAPQIKFCINHCFQMLFGHCIIPRAFENNGLCKIWRKNKECCGECENRELQEKLPLLLFGYLVGFYCK